MKHKIEYRNWDWLEKFEAERHEARKQEIERSLPSVNGFRVGDKVVVSEEGLQRGIFRRSNGKVGKVIGFSRDGKCIRFVWDGSVATSIQSAHHTFLKLYEPKIETNANTAGDN